MALVNFQLQSPGDIRRLQEYITEEYRMADKELRTASDFDRIRLLQGRCDCLKRLSQHLLGEKESL